MHKSHIPLTPRAFDKKRTVFDVLEIFSLDMPKLAPIY